MAIFELDDGHGTLVQPMRPSADSFDHDTATLVAENISDLIGEQVLTVREGGPGGPQVLALDAAAQPVVVEVTQLLDAEHLIRSLAHAGGAGRMSRADMARAYRGGPEAFEADLAVFRDRAPLVRAERAHAGVRLVVVCAEVADGLLDAVEFVAGGTQVQVMRLGVTHGPGGRRYLDVSPLRPHASRERRAVEPGPATGSIGIVARAAAAAPTSETPITSVSTDAGGPEPVGSDPLSGLSPVSGADPLSAPSPAPVPSPVSAPIASDPPGSRDALDHSAPDPDPAYPTRRSREAAPEPVPAPTRDTSADETTVLAPILDNGSASAGPVPHALPELAALAAAERKPIELVWLRVRRGQRLVATLRTDGLLRLADGSLHADPNEAATAAADLERPADGWRMWRFGDHGPTLGEAVGIH